MYKRAIQAASIAFVSIMIMLMYACAVSASGIKIISISPNDATTNSIFRLKFVVIDDKGVSPDVGSLELILKTPGGIWSVTNISPFLIGASKDGIEHNIAMTGGLTPFDKAFVVDPIYPDTRVWPDKGDDIYQKVGEQYLIVPSILPVTTAPVGAPQTYSVIVQATWTDKDGKVTVVKSDGVPMTVCDSHWISDFNDEFHSYGGYNSDRDYLWGYAIYGDDNNSPTPVTDPLATNRWDGALPDMQENPDDGTGSTEYTFRVMYRNLDNRAPVKYITDGRFMAPLGDPLYGYVMQRKYINDYDGTSLFSEAETGVVLYIGLQNGEYYPLPMQKENPADSNYAAGVIYKYVLKPEFRNNYRALPNGTYKYFFGCSDDKLFDAFGNTLSWIEPAPYWPDNGNLSLVPETSRVDFPERWNWYDINRYVDRSSYEPGVDPNGFTTLTNLYKYPAYEHPVVSMGLDPGEGFYYKSPWIGTQEPAYRMVDPLTQYNVSGASASTPVNFGIYYSQVNGIAPKEISVWINNADDDTNSTLYPYTRHTLIRADNTGNIKTGVLYKLPSSITLPVGPHTYYFTATSVDETASPNITSVTRFPVNTPVNVEEPLDNSFVHYFHGPYINHKPTLSNGQVDRISGVAGDRYRFSITYTDADNQRPYKAHMIIQYNDKGDTEEVAMTKLNPAASNYKDGVTYVFDTANLQNRLQAGARKYRFVFTDDWGGLTDPNDRVVGETVTFPETMGSGEPTWIEGLYVGANNRPLLRNGSVSSSDGTANSATVWNYKVSYVSPDNHKPAGVNVYIGQLNQDGTTITWDAGHAMDEVNASDTVYNDGKDFKFSTRLAGTDAGIKYYYSFVASDGIDLAQYNGETSPSAHAVWSTDEVRSAEGEITSGHPGERLNPMKDDDKTIFQASRYPLVGVIPASPIFNLYRYPNVYDETGSLLSYEDDYTVDFATGVITLNDPSSFIDVQYWFGMAGPNAVGGNVPPVLSNGGVNPESGTSSGTYTFQVSYKDPDGAAHAPSFVHLVLGGEVINLTPVATTGVDYSVGVTYTSKATTLNPGVHSFYFEASDGAGYAVFDANAGHSSTSINSGYVIVPIAGPYVNDLPTLKNGKIEADDATDGIFPDTRITYSVTYTDANNDAPNAGYPVVYIDNAAETDFSGTVTSMGKRTITDHTRNWTVDQFKGMPVQFTSGPLVGIVYTIAGNTKDTLALIANDIAADGLALDSGTPVNFSIGALRLTKDPNQNSYTDGIVYSITIPGLGVSTGLPNKTHTAHFKSITDKTIGPKTTKPEVARFSLTGELQGPKVIAPVKPTGDVAPVLANGTVDPEKGGTSTDYTFSVLYSDKDNDAPEPHDGVLGSITLVLDGQIYDMDEDPYFTGNYIAGETFTYQLSGLTPGKHSYHFVASDGYSTTRFPAVGENTMDVNHAPVLSTPTVTPELGNNGTTFTYKVVYTDADNDAADKSSIKLWIDRKLVDLNVDPTAYTLSQDSVNYSDGVTYSFTMRPGYFDGADGSHRFSITANDGIEPAAEVSKLGPWVNVSTKSGLSGGIVTSSNYGYVNDKYTWSVTYRNDDGKAPDYVKVYIDGDDEADAHLMTLAAGTDYAAGVTYTYTQDGLAAGDHTYRFACATETALDSDPETGHYDGPNVTILPKADISIGCTLPLLGQVSSVSGNIMPTNADKLVIHATAPDGKVKLYTAVPDNTGAYNYDWIPDAVGTWTLESTWGGNAQYGKSSSGLYKVDIKQDSVSIDGVDMISLPFNPVDPTDPTAVFGDPLKFALARWVGGLSSSNAPTYHGAYKMFSKMAGITSDADFPDLAAGQGFWIKTVGPVKVTVQEGTEVPLDVDFAPIHLYPGWNQIGDPYMSEINWADLKISRNGTTVDITTAANNSHGWVRDYGWVFDPISKQYKLVHATMKDAQTNMRPWRGYWMKALVECDLIIPAPGK